MDLFSFTIIPFIRSLEALAAMLDKARAHAQSKQPEWLPAGAMESALLNDRIIFDQFPLIKQVQIACDNAKGCAARLAEIENPKHEDSEKTFDELQERIQKTLDFMKTIGAKQINGKEDILISLPYWQGKQMRAADYVTEYLVPNFYFHMTTAYSILRKNGIDIGKADYTGPLSFTK